MTTKAEKLAWELVALAQRYHARDFEKATDMLMSGELFSRAVDGSRKARTASAKRSTVAAQSSPHKASEPVAAPTKADSADQAQLELESWLANLNDVEQRDELAKFASKFQARAILKTGLMSRAFAEQIGLNLPKTLPPRPRILEAILLHLHRLPAVERSSALKYADQADTGISALKRWSDLIVKKAPDQSR